MIQCPYCAKPLEDNSQFCNRCGGRIIPRPPVSQAVPQTMVPVAQATPNDEAREFVETTRRLLRWERNAWKISGVAFTISGSVFAGLFFLFALVFMSMANSNYYTDSFVLSSVYIVYAIYFLMLFLPLGIVGLLSANKIPYYLDAIDHSDIAPAVKRCGSVGMLVMAALFNNIAFVFFLINFVRMKTNQQLIRQLTYRQY